MPKVEIDYSNTIIYKITCKDPSITDVYVGHTTNFVQRKHCHKQSCNNNNCKLYKVIRDNGGWQNWIMEIVNFFNCNDHYEARKKEQEYFILLNATLNSIEPLPKPKEKKVVIKCNPNQPLTYDVSNTIFGNEKLNEEHIKITNKFVCEKCDFECCKNSEMKRHLLTSKHKNRTFLNEKNTENATPCFVCKNCNKTYKARNSLWYHQNKCEKQQEAKTFEILDDNQIDIKSLDMNLIMQLLKQNEEFKNLMVEQNTMLSEAYKIAKEVTIDKTL